MSNETKSFVESVVGIVLVVLFCLFCCGVFTGCCDDGRPRGPKPDYIIKVCSLGDTDGSTCVTIDAKDYSIHTPYISIKTLDGELLRYNWEGWAIVIREVD